MFSRAHRLVHLPNNTNTFRENFRRDVFKGKSAVGSAGQGKNTAAENANRSYSEPWNQAVNNILKSGSGDPEKVDDAGNQH